MKSRSNLACLQGYDLDVVSIVGDINKKLDSLMTLKDTVGNIEQSMQLLSDKYAEVLDHLKEQSKEFMDLKKRVEAVERTEDEITKLRQEFNDLEWHSQECNLEIHGIPQSYNEDLSKVNETAAKLGTERLTDMGVAAVHRLPARPNKPPGIIICSTRQSVKEHWLSKKRNLKHLETAVHILENMTKQSKALWNTISSTFGTETGISSSGKLTGSMHLLSK